MLYDPKWEKPEVKDDPFSLESLIAWLETMPADGKYSALDPANCLLGQFATAMGAVDEVDVSQQLSGIKTFKDIAFDARAERMNWTFGAALRRARSILSKEQDHG